MEKFKCKKCNKEFHSYSALSGHMKSHGPSMGISARIMCCCLYTRKKMKASKIDEFQRRYFEYLSNPNKCKTCEKDLMFDKRFNKYCSSSCSTKITNKQRKKTTKGKEKSLICSTCGKVYQGSIHTPKCKGLCKECIKNKKVQNIKSKAFSKIPWRICNHCKKQFISRRKLKYCDNCSYLYKTTNRVKYKFTFNIFNFPDLFDLELLKNVGFYAPGGKAGRWNIQGFSRDHKVSVNEAIKNNYDPYYITHPLNCELLPHIDNTRKNSKSSISYDLLKMQVNEYDLKASRGRLELPSSG